MHQLDLFRTEVRGTRLVWSTLADWLALAEELAWRIEPSTPHYRRCDQLYRSLRSEHVWQCEDRATLVRLALFFDRKGRWRGWLHGPERCFSAAELGAWRTTVHNRIVALDRPARAKGPRFDPARLPEAALQRLIQQHRDMAVVEQLRAELRRRQSEHSN